METYTYMGSFVMHKCMFVCLYIEVLSSTLSELPKLSSYVLEDLIPSKEVMFHNCH